MIKKIKNFKKVSSETKFLIKSGKSFLIPYAYLRYVTQSILVFEKVFDKRLRNLKECKA
ncbi:hypothetical protein CDIMF43_140015 [Carnobacterium divergens]|nr:hypothetical protein CDIV41_120015 [Carnobacterium divergens]SPC38368.1 hypothetical protein CDIMF43_140015 [Carnobacterium divergens]